VILFDEIEKAHPEVFNVLLQILDDGRVTDAQGRTVDFKNTVIIMTSNIGSEYLLEGIADDGTINEDARDHVLNGLRSHFRPEFLNRVDDVVLFKPLSRQEIVEIVELQVVELARRLEDQHLHLELTEQAKQFIAAAAYDPVYGARPLKRYIQHQLETKIGRAIVAGELLEGMVIKVSSENDDLIVSLEQGPKLAAV